MTQAPLHWGILGASDFALRRMLPAFAAASGTELIALATASAEKAAPFQAVLPQIRHHATYEALLADPKVEAVYIPLPNHLHAPWAVKALHAGKHVLVEKPLALDLAGGQAIAAAARQTGRFAAEAFMILHHPQWARARDWLAEGAIGQLRHIDIAFSFNNPDPANIRNRPETGGGVLYDIGVYAFGAARFLGQAEPLDLRVQLQRENGVDVQAEVSAPMAGPSGTFTFRALVSMRLFPRQEVILQGDEGLLRLNAPFNAEVFAEPAVTLHRAGGQVKTHRFPEARQYQLQLENFRATVQDGAAYPCPLDFSLGTAKMIEAAFAAAG